jgi:hypothetical protein
MILSTLGDAEEMAVAAPAEPQPPPDVTIWLTATNPWF